MDVKIPRISVVITAHDRRAFLLDAMQSLITQTIDRDQFEVIVVKNYRDRDLDDFASIHGIRTQFTTAVAVGSKMAEGIRLARADIIALLEDDDLFESDKLEKLLAYYEEDDDIVLIHNSYSIVGESGELVQIQPLAISNTFLPPGPSFISACLRSGISTMDLGFSSCLSFKKSILTGYLSSMEKIQAAPDFFVILSFLDQNKKGLHLEENLTKYRSHSSQSNRTGDFSSFVEGNTQIRTIWVEDYTVMLRCFVQRFTKVMASFSLRYNDLFVQSLSMRRSIVKKTIRVLKLLRHARILGFHGGWSLVFFALFSIMSPIKAQRRYYELRREKYSSETESVL